MELITDIDSKKELIERCFARYGHEPEHCFYNFKSQENEDDKFYFFYFSGTGYGVPVIHYAKENVWYFETEPLAPKEHRLDIIKQCMEFVFSIPETKKIFIETSPEIRRALIKFSKEAGKYSVRPPRWSYYCPVYDLKAWDPELKGGDWKKLRNIINAFKKDKNVEVVDARTVDKEKLKQVIRDWEKNRVRKHDEIENLHHYNSVDDGFKNYLIARAVLVNGEPCSITAGWPVPNSKMYYSSLGITNFKHEGLGEFCNVDDLSAIKAAGFEFAHFGGSDKRLLQFKLKFKPCKIVKEYLYYVVRKENNDAMAMKQRSR